MKTWEKVLCYFVGLYLCLVDGMKIVSKKAKPALAMLLAVVMLCGMLPATAMAASTAKVKVGGISLADGQCLTGNGATAATTWAEGDNYVALYKGGVLYINNLEISGEGAAISFQGSMDLIIDVSGENTLVRTDGSCIDITSYTYGLVVQGSGTLSATGSGFGIWVRENVTIQGDVTLTVEGTSDAGIASNRGNTGLSDTSITIKDNAFVTATGGKHGLGGDHDRTPRVVVEGNATVVAKGGTYAIRKLTADTVSGQRVLAGTDITGSNKEEYVADNNSTYKYVEVNYGTGIAYLDSTGAKQYCDEYTSVDGSTTWNAGWYYVGSDVTISNRITVTGDVHLILGNGYTLTASEGIRVEEGNSLTIYAQSKGENMGELNATVAQDIYEAAIGGNQRADGGNITINGGVVTAVGGRGSAGIGGGQDGCGGNITVNGGTVTATGGNYGAGIGGGEFGSGGNITINGGTVTATGGSYAAGIGGGEYGVGGNITINGGTVTAIGGSCAAGIGGGEIATGGIIKIGNATVQATGSGDAQDIGYGEFGGDPSYKVIFDANGGTGTMYQMYLPRSLKYALPESDFTAPEGKSLAAWSIDGVEYQPGDKITISRDITISAVWEAPHTCNIQPVEKVWPDCDNGGKEAYYKCDGCGKFFEDANGTTEIANIDSWGNLPKREHAVDTSRWEHDGQNHWHVCSYASCSKKVESTVEAHASTGANVATCTKKAVCDVCGVTYGDFVTHNYTAKTKNQDTLKSAGNCRDKAVYWYSCSVCGKVENDDNHTFTGDKVADTHVGGTELVNQAEANHKTQTNGYSGDTKCLGCGEILGYGQAIPAGAHTPANDWSCDGEYHWKECAATGCGTVIDGSKATHSSTGNNVATCTKKAVCDDCGATYGDFAGHDWNTVLEKDANGHWYKCNTADCTEKKDFASHTPNRAEATETEPVNCTVCGYEITPVLGHIHAHSTEWKSDADNHWNECACGNKANAAAHTDANTDGKCDTCGYNVGTTNDEEQPSDNPKTGDSSKPWMWAMVAFMSSLALAASVVCKKRKA